MEDLLPLQSSCWDDFLIPSLAPIETGFGFVLMFVTNWLYFKVLPYSLNEATIKQQMTLISDYIIVCLFQNYKNMWNKKTDATGKRLSKVVSSKTCNSQGLFELSFLCV